MEYKVPRLMIAAPASGSGKTLITCGLLSAWKRMGKQTAAFKCGPDYIDPMFHESVISVPSKNLDTYFTNDKLTVQLLLEDAKEADISIMEGVMGYYDGVAGVTVTASSYELAKVTHTPVILVVDAKGSSISLCATIQGFLNYKTPSYIQGIILNRISPSMYERMKRQIESELHIPVCGYMPKLNEFALENRHLGLVMPEEIPDLREKFITLGKMCSQTVDMEQLVHIAEGAEAICSEPLPIEPVYKEENRVRIAVAKDEAFSFYYKDNLKLMEKLGAELVYFSPLHDQQLPERISGMYLGGGYPELYANVLSKNDEMRRLIRQALTAHMPCIAECGGFLYLQKSLKDKDGHSYEMVGYLEGESHYTGKLGRFGYIEIESQREQLLVKTKGRIKGHEFHYMDSTTNGQDFIARKPCSEKIWECVQSNAYLYGGFPHLYLYSNIEAAKRFVQAAGGFR